MADKHPADCAYCPGEPGTAHAYTTPAEQARRIAAARAFNARVEAARKSAAR